MLLRVPWHCALRAGVPAGAATCLRASPGAAAAAAAAAQRTASAASAAPEPDAAPAADPSAAAAATTPATSSASESNTTTSTSTSTPADSTSTTMMTERLGLIGAGQMAAALVRALMDRGCIDAKSGVCASDHSTALARSLGIEKCFAAAAAGGAELVAHASDVVLIGVKPQGVPEVLAALRPHIVPSRHLVVSIAAGVTLATYERALPKGTRVVRVMPNTPLLVGAGASAYSLGACATEEDERRVRALLEPGGLVLKVPEDLMDAVTAVSGSGPA